MEQLLILRKHDELCKLKSGSRNETCGLHDEEVQHLAYLAYHIPRGGDIVDVGSHKGKSICVSGTAVLERGNIKARLFAIDLWTDGKTTYKNQRSPAAKAKFYEQVEQMGLTDRIRVLQTSSLKAASKRGKPIHLLFLDASHKYASVLADYKVWSRFVAPGGHIALHDYGTRFKGVDRVVEEEAIPSGLWDDIHVYDRIWSARRKW